MKALYKRRLLRAAEIVEKAGNYDQGLFYHECGAPACVLGHYQHATNKLTRWQVRYFDSDIADHFGISSSEMHELFAHLGCGNAKTGKQAAEYIRKFVERKYG